MNKPLDKSYPDRILSLGGAIRKRRMDLGLRQKDVAKIIGCDVDTITNWKKGRRFPRIAHTTKIAQFLGFNPYSEGPTLAERLVTYRKFRGLRQKDFARHLGIDPSTLAAYEQGRQPAKEMRNLLEKALKAPN